MRSLHLVIDGDPVPKGRARVDTRGKRPRVYTPKQTAAFEKRIADVAREVRESAGLVNGEPWPMRAPAYMVSVGVYARSRSCDADNVFKSVADALIGVLYADDRRVGGAFPPTIVSAKPCTTIDVVAFDELDGDDELAMRTIAICTRIARAKPSSVRAMLPELRSLLLREDLPW